MHKIKKIKHMLRIKLPRVVKSHGRLVLFIVIFGFVGAFALIISFALTADTTPPSAPQNATSGNPTPTTVTIYWQASTDTESGVDHYEVHFENNYTQDGSYGTVFQAPAPAGVTNLSFVATKLRVYTNYTVYVMAVDKAGNKSAQSNYISPNPATTADNVYPTRPANLKAHFNVTTRSSYLTWDAATDNVGIDHYNIYRDPGFVKIGETKNLTYTDIVPPLDQAVKYSVSAVDTWRPYYEANESGTSLPATVSTDVQRPGPASNIRAGGQPTNSSISLAWTDPVDNVGLKSIKIIRDGIEVGTQNPGNGTYYDGGLQPGTTHKYVVLGVDNNDNVSDITLTQAAVITTTGTASDNQSPTVTVSAPTANQTVKGTLFTTATASDNKAVTKVEFYVDGQKKSIKQGGASSYSFKWVTTGNDNGDHIIMVAAYDAAGNAPGTQQIKVHSCNIDCSVPLAPTLTDAKMTSLTHVHLAWTASTDDIGVDGYYVLENNIPIAQFGSTATSFDGDRSTNSVYNYQIVAFDAARNYSPLSNTKQVTTGYVGSGGDGFNDKALPSLPANFKITKITPQQVKLTWSESTDDRGIEGYDVFKDDRWVSIRQMGTSFVDTDLVAGSRHTYQIRAVDTSLKTSAKESLSVTTDSQTANTGNMVGALLDEHSYVGLRPVVSFTLTDGTIETAKPVKPDGFYVFNDIPAGTYTVTYNLGGFVKQTRNVSITADKTTTVDMLIPKLFK